MANNDLTSVAKAQAGRLEAFPISKVKAIREKILGRMWPNLEGVLVVLFTARSGSTFLTRELEFVYDIGVVGETLNPEQAKGHPLDKVLRKRRGAWFGCKAGVPGVIAGETYGFFDMYTESSCFLRLVRRDVVDQAISFCKAEQTGQWHAHNASDGRAAYDAQEIAKAIAKIVAGVDQLRRYAEFSGRPCGTVFYEDFAEGDFTSVLAACDALGVPRRPPDAAVEHRSVERMSDDTNIEWRTRFLEDMDPRTRSLIERYAEALNSQPIGAAISAP